jgi:excinuclease ABC subunit C
MAKIIQYESNAGIKVIREALKTLTEQPGVYRMLDKNGNVLYIGKAKRLVKRVVSYTYFDKLPDHQRIMVTNTAKLEVITTKDEAEALLLEASLIKSLKPRYNILFRDDKSFPYILIRADHKYNSIIKYRGNKTVKGKYFGPFASANDVDNVISYLQKTFLLRSCSDSFFASRTKPCILYQLKRCSAPCVDKISYQDYKELVQDACEFLSGKTATLQKKLSELMQEASENLNYELAALYRDRIKSLSRIQAKQNLFDVYLDEVDIIAIHEEFGQFCVQIFFFKGGQSYGNKSMFPSNYEGNSKEEVLSAFIGQFYQDHIPAKKVIVNIEIVDATNIQNALSLIAKQKISLFTPKKGGKYNKVINFAEQNAKEALLRKFANDIKQRELLLGVQKLFGLPRCPERIEVYDNSHLSGDCPVGVMIVATESGFNKNAYRRFNISLANAKKAGGGDDYSMLREVLTRRLTRLKKEFPEYTKGEWPDMLLIDGGPGHFQIALEVLHKLDLRSIFPVCIAKGPDRNAGKEHFYTENHEPFTLDKDTSVMRYLQILRDEAHIFAIRTHRKQRTKSITASVLDNIPFIGAKRKKALLNYFGSTQAIEDAKVEDLQKVESINKNIAQGIYNYLHNQQ